MITKELLKKVVEYAHPGIRRGPASDDWVEMMREVADALGWSECEECSGTGIGPRDICISCLGIGKIDSDEW